MDTLKHRKFTLGDNTAAVSKADLPLHKPVSTKSQVRLVLLVVIAVFLGEILVMFALSLLPAIAVWGHALIDAAMLVILVSPVLYFGLFRSLIRQLEERRKLLRELEKHKCHLEDLVSERTMDLSKTNQSLSNEIRERAAAQKEILLKTRQLSESVKQLNCLYSISKLLGNPDLPLEELLQRVVDLIPAGLRSPDNAYVKIQFENREFKTAGGQDTRLKLTRDIHLFDEKLGNLQVCYRQAESGPNEKSFQKEETNLIHTVADQLENAILLHKRGDNLREALLESCRHQDEVAALLEGARAILKNREFEPAARTIFHQCRNLLGASAGYVALLNSAGTENEVLFLHSGQSSCTVDPSIPMPIRGLRAEAYSKGAAVYENNFSSSAWVDLLPAGHVGLKNALFAPMIVDGRAAGLIGLANKHNGFDDNDLRIASAFGELAAVALLNSRSLESLQNSEERFRSVVATAIEAIIVIDSRGAIQFWNKGAQKMFGYSAKETNGRDLNRIIPKRFQSAHRCAVRQVVETGQSKLAGRTLNMTGRRQNGQEFPLELTLAMWQANKELYFTAVIRDVTERKEAEAALNRLNRELEDRVIKRTAELQREINERKLVELKIRQSKTMLQAVFDGIADPLILVDKDMRIKMMNKKAAGYYGIGDYNEAVGKICHQASGKSELCSDCQIPAAAAKGQYVSFERRSFMNPDAIERVVVYPVEDGNEDIGEAIVRITDITEDKQLERRLIQSEKMASLGVLVSSIAHEINNPNNFVTFNIPILKEYATEIVPYLDEYARAHPEWELCNQPYAEFRRDIFKLIDNIQNGARRISIFVANLREYTQGGSLKALSWLDLAVLIDKVLVIIQAEIKKRVKIFKKSIAADLPEIYSDPHAIEQILINLLLNASQAVDGENSSVALTVKPGEDLRDVVVEITDNGCGMDAQEQLKIFDPFFTTKQAAKGTGLGLYVCHNLIQALDGRIEVESEPGQGSKFRVILPAIKP